MLLQTIDWVIIIAYMTLSLAIGFWVARQAGKSAASFFLSGRSMPWWLLGVSMVATTFSTDTPNLVADIVRQNGVAGNWTWWAFLLTGMLTVFVYAKLWRRSGVLTDLEFYEIRYSGPAAAFLRGFRAVYLGVFFNVMVMATVSLAAIKIGGVLFGWEAEHILLVSLVVTAAFSTAGGLTGVVLTDMVLFVMAMIGSVSAAVVALDHPKVGGLSGLMANEAVREKLAIVPAFDDPAVFVPLIVVPLAVQWWASWYPGAEPGGGGYVAQRMLAAKSESHAMGATLLFNVAHYALRPWPWILVALASIAVYPDIASLAEAFPHVEQLGHDLAYSAMLTLLPPGLLGLVVASLAAAFMSTISTHLNWGSSYVVNDVYKRFVKPQADERELVLVGRISTVVLMLLAALLALQLQNALQAFQILLQIGAGTGLLFILRWFWWRVNAWAEIVAMAVSFTVALVFFMTEGAGLEAWQQLLVGVAVTTVAWIAACFLAPPTDDETLRGFYRLTQPGGPGWQRIRETEPDLQESTPWDVPQALLSMLFGCAMVYSTLFATGYWLYGQTGPALGTSVVAAVSAVLLVRAWRRNTAG